VEKNVWLRADTLREGRAGRMVTSVTVPITGELLDQIAPEMSVVRFVITRPASPDDPPGKRFDLPGPLPPAKAP